MSFRTQIEISEFGNSPSGVPAQLFTLKREGGIMTKITNFGGIVTELHVPDKEGQYMDVVLGFKDIYTYVKENIYAGAIVGRIAGRVTKGLCPVDGTIHQLSINSDDYHVHGGIIGLDKRLWRAEIIEYNDDNALKLQYLSHDGEEGYPGNVDITVFYSLTREGGLRIDFTAVTDKATPLCLTNHSYFNLSGEKEVANHIIQIESSQFVEVDNRLISEGKKKKVIKEINSFKKQTRLGDRLMLLHKYHGDNYILNNHGKIRRVALAYCGKRSMEVFTNASNLQFYTGVGLNTRSDGKNGTPYNKFAGLCFECQRFSDALNHPDFNSIIVNPGDIYSQTVEYRFSNC